MGNRAYFEHLTHKKAFAYAESRGWLILNNNDVLTHLRLTEYDLINGYLGAFFEWRPHRNLLHILALDTGWITIDLNDILGLGNGNGGCMD